MNIAIDIQPLVSGSKVRGIGAYTKGLLNEPGERTSHRYKTPCFGGISIFIAAITTSLFFVSGANMDSFKIFYLESELSE